STSAQTELALVGPYANFGTAAIHLGSMGAVARIRCADIASEVAIRVAAMASQVGVQIETALARHSQVDAALVGVDPHGRRHGGEIGPNVAFVRRPPETAPLTAP